MIRFRVKQRIADRQFQTGRHTSLTEVARAIGVTRGTLSKMANQSDYNATLNLVDRLCTYFDCEVGEIIERVPEMDRRRVG